MHEILQQKFYSHATNGNSTHNAKVPSLMTNPKDQDLADHAMSKFHLVSSLTFLKKTRISKKPSPSLFPTGKHKSEFLTSLCSLFLLRKELEALLCSFCQTHGSTHQKKDKAYLILLSTLSKQLEQSRTLSLSFPQVQHQKEESSQIFSPFHTYGSSSKKEASFNSLKLSTSHTFESSHQEREFLSCMSDSMSISLKNHKLGKGFSYSHLRIHDLFKEFLVRACVVCKIRKS